MLSIPLYGLVGYNLNQARSLEGAIKYLVLSASGSALMLFGIALLYAQYGTLSLTGIGEQLANLNGQFPPMTMIAAVLVLIAMAFKLSLVPFHVWTPDVYEGAPAPIGAYLATTAKIAVAAVLLRLVGYLPVFSHEALRTALMLLAALSIIGGNLLAMLQTNIKRLLGYSSIAHFGYLMMAVVALNPTLTPSSYLVYLTAYLLATLAIFGVVTVVTAQQPDSDAADADQLFRYRGLYWRHPTLAIVMTIALLSLAGIPATVGFIGKFYVMLAAVSASEWALLGALVIGSAIGLYYYLRVMVSLYLEAPTAQEAASSCWSRTATIAVLVMLALLITLLGIMPSDLFAITASAELM